MVFYSGMWRATFIIAFKIPISLVSFIYLFATGESLNVISLSSSPLQSVWWWTMRL
ncbi:MAG: hypothetical protein ACLU4N_06540 [Butyricimonas faecihominis]